MSGSVFEGPAATDAGVVQVLGSAQREQGDLTSQLSAARQAALQAQQQAEQALANAQQAAAQAAEQSAARLTAQEQQAAAQAAALQQLVRQLQQQLQDATGQVVERSAAVVQLQSQAQQVEVLQQQLEEQRAAVQSLELELHGVTAQSKLLNLQRGIRCVHTHRCLQPQLFLSILHCFFIHVIRMHQPCALQQSVCCACLQGA
jgi:predicted RNase H-like nuclease (RuvC/YqgF family)